MISDSTSKFVIEITQVCVQTLACNFYGILISYVHRNISTCEFILYWHSFVKACKGTSWLTFLIILFFLKHTTYEYDIKVFNISYMCIGPENVSLYNGLMALNFVCVCVCVCVYVQDAEIFPFTITSVMEAYPTT